MNKLEKVVVVVPEKSKRQDKDYSENKVVNKQELVVPKESVFRGPSTIDGKMQVNMHQDTVVVKLMHVSEVLAKLEVSKENGRSMNSRGVESQVAEAAMSKGRKWKKQQPAERVFTSSAVSNKENSNSKVEGPTSKPKKKQVQDLNEEGLQDNLNARQGSTLSSSMGNRGAVTEKLKECQANM
ncbi:16904_t:CDS:2, partial [Dentiscutata heterogama]